MMARMGGDGDTDLDLEAEPVTVISYEFPAQMATSP
jgi:hypothetical protein